MHPKVGKAGLVKQVFNPNTDASGLSVMFFISAMASGGAERVASNLANRWAAMNHSVSVVNLAAPTDSDYQLRSTIKRITLDGMRDSTHLLQSLANNFRRIKALRKVIKSESPDVLVAFLTSSNVVAILAAIGTGTRVIVSERCHPPNTDASFFWLKLRPLVYRWAHRVVVLAQESKDWVLANTGCRHSSVVVIPNMLTWPLPTYPGFITPPPKEEGTFRLLAVGRLVVEKNYPLLLKAFSALPKDMNHWSLSIVGGGDSAELLRLADELGIRDRVEFVGRAGNVSDWFNACDLYVLSSLSEGFPNSLAEAMASGCAVISTDCDTGPRDIIKHKHDGWLVPNQDAVSLTQAMALLMADEPLRVFLARNAGDVLERYSESAVMPQWDNLLFSEQARAERG